MPSSYITVAYIFKAAKFFILSNYKRSSLEKPYMRPKPFFRLKLSDVILSLNLFKNVVQFRLEKMK